MADIVAKACRNAIDKAVFGKKALNQTPGLLNARLIGILKAYFGGVACDGNEFVDRRVVVAEDDFPNRLSMGLGNDGHRLLQVRIPRRVIREIAWRQT